MIFVRWFVQFFWIGLCAVALLWQTWLLQDIPHPTDWLTVFVFCSTVFGYNYVAPKRRRYAAFVVGAIGTFCFLKLNLTQQLMVALPALIWLLYYDRYRPGKGAGLRQFPILKPVAISLAWAWVTILLPTPLHQWTSVLVLVVGQSAFIFALALAYDLCDQPYDLRHGLDTLVLVLGPRNSIRLVDLALTLATITGLLYWLTGAYTWQTAAALAVSYAFTAWAIRLIPQQIAWVGWNKAAIDGLMIFQFILVWLSTK